MLLFACAAALCHAQTPLHRDATVPRHRLEFEQIESPRGEVVLSVVSTDQGILLAGTATHGVMRSTDGGDSWQQTELRKQAVWPMYITPDGTILAFTVQGMLGGQEVAYSTDTGESWQMVPDSVTKYYGHAVVRSMNGVIYSEGGGGLHRSTDDGRTWETLQTEPPIKRCFTDYQLVVLSDSVMFSVCYRGLFRSGDGGRTWQKISLRHAIFSELLPDPAGGVLVVGRDTSLAYHHDLIRVSSDGSASEVLGPTPWRGSEASWIILRSGTLLIGERSTSDGMLRSTDSARTWSSTSVITGAVNDFCQASDGTVYAAMHGTISRSRDDGITWEECSNGMAKREILHLFKDAESGIYVGTLLGGLYYSSDQGGNWIDCGTGLCTVFEGLSVGSDHVLIATGSATPFNVYTLEGMFHQDWFASGFLLRLSRDSAKTWIPPQLSSLPFWSIGRIAQGEGMRVYSNGVNLNLSDDGGETWNSEPVLSLASDLYFGSEGLCSLRNDTLYFRQSDFESWSAIRIGKNIRLVGGSSGAILTLENNSIVRSSDKGAHWETVFQLSEEMYSRKFVSLSPNTMVLLGGDYCCYLSTDRGMTWEQIVLNESRRIPITSALIDSDDRLLLGSYEGLYRSTNPLPGSYVWHRFSLGIPYPNPAVSSVTVPYSLEEDGYVRMTLTDVSGRERLVIFEGQRTAGTYFGWISPYFGWEYEAGLYFCNLSVNDRVQSQPIVFP
ncbi:MAG: hypothetical protein WC824_00820 [Bacteroidota bacterium]